MTTPTSPASDGASGTPRTNWSGTYTYRATSVARPESISALAALIRAASRIRPLGTRHAFNDVADVDGWQVNVAALTSWIEIDVSARTATVNAGLSYAEIAPVLHAAGFGLPALASLPHLSVAGACATASHGSGHGIGNLATQVSALEFVDGTGTVRTLSRAGDPDTFPGAVVSLGALGAVTSMTLDLVPTYDVAQTVRLSLPAAVFVDRFAEITGAAYSVSCFTRWIDIVDQVWCKVRVGDRPPDETVFTEAPPADVDVHPVPGGSPADCTPQRGVPGPWHERLPHFAAGRTPSFGDEIQSEFFVDASAAPAAAVAMFGIGRRIAPALRISEVRTIAADDLWLSPARGRDVVGFHFTWISDESVVLPALDLVEATLEPFAPVPHWGKVFTTRTAPRGTDDPRFAKLGAFAALADRYDPDRRFVNDFLVRNHLR
jgi:alditol oxidase